MTDDILDWVELTPEEKEIWNRAVNDQRLINSTPTMFNLESDRHDPPSRFPDMTREEVIASAKESAAFLKKNYLCKK